MANVAETSQYWKCKAHRWHRLQLLLRVPHSFYCSLYVFAIGTRVEKHIQPTLKSRKCLNQQQNLNKLQQIMESKEQRQQPAIKRNVANKTTEIRIAKQKYRVKSSRFVGYKLNRGVWKAGQVTTRKGPAITN